ncbi:PREDICTED: uncharacterized protein LOC106818086, partial [Priapulus caudatus]|uniref:Uncharacterized protein LOC106818086 n=1 Tax=Priapulus caudatus TaxID=37621 RepID=A0ABM1F1G8_PRICU
MDDYMDTLRRQLLLLTEIKLPGGDIDKGNGRVNLRDRLPFPDQRDILDYADVQAKRASVQIADSAYRMFQVQLGWFTERMNALERKMDNLHALHHTRRTRSIFSGIGKLSKFLFGTATDDDVQQLQQNIAAMQISQTQTHHIIDQALTVINYTKIHTQMNTQILRDVIRDTKKVATAVETVTRQVYEWRTAAAHESMMISRLQVALTGLQLAFAHARDQIDAIQRYVNILLTGRLPPTLVPPTQLSEILAAIQESLPDTVTLPYPYSTQLLRYYDMITAVVVPTPDALHVLAFISLSYRDMDFRIYEIITPPVFLPNSTSTKTGLTSQTAAYYETDNRYIGISLDRSVYIYPDALRLQSCLRQHRVICDVYSPIFPATAINSCAIALYQNDVNQIQTLCHKRVVFYRKPDPQARYIANGKWLISAPAPFKIVISCQAHSTAQIKVTELTIERQKLIQLRSGCKADAAAFTLPPYFFHETNVSGSAPAQALPEIIRQIPQIWKQLYEVHNGIVINSTALIPTAVVPPQLYADADLDVSFTDLVAAVERGKQIASQGTAYDHWDTADYHVNTHHSAVYGILAGIIIMAGIALVCYFRCYKRGLWQRFQPTIPVTFRAGGVQRAALPRDPTPVNENRKAEIEMMDIPLRSPPTTPTPTYATITSTS